ncbi:MAG: hypothetical protein ACRDJP_01700 [Actinomycetota bacterium]
MSCVTCEITPPEGHGGPIRINAGHIGIRFGDGGLGLAVLYRGMDVTLQAVEAFAGGEDDGWVEMRVVSSDGTPTIHPADPERGIEAHVVTVIRRGQTHIARGSQLVTGDRTDSAPE